MTRDGKVGIGIVGFALVVYFYLIPLGIEQPVGRKAAVAVGLFKSVALSTRLFPALLTITLGVLGVLLILIDFLKKKEISEKTFRQSTRIRYRSLITMGIVIAYFWLIPTMGYLYATILTLAMMIYCFGMRNWIRILLVATIFPFLLYLSIEKMMLIPLPTGMLPVFP